jgi:hypothetical protein
MAYIRRRTTKAGSVSTALVESYRDEKGRPRQRLLANLHGEPDTTRALAKLIVQNESPNDAHLAIEMNVIKEHCSATPEEIQAAIRTYKQTLDEAVAYGTGALLYKWKHDDLLKAAKVKLRRMRR